jgi:tellurite resistance protein TehA-like permease
MSRQVLARTAALFYLLNFVLGGLAFSFVQKGRGPVADAVTLAAALDYAIVALLLGRLFEVEDRAFSWGVAAVGLMGCALSAAQSLHLVGTQINPLAIFGLYCLGLGVLIVRSALVPRIIGFLLMLGGVSWLTFAAPALAAKLLPVNMAPGAISELIFTLWLLVFGVRALPLSHANAPSSPSLEA